jgi:hypothetical protein
MTLTKLKNNKHEYNFMLNALLKIYFGSSLCIQIIINNNNIFINSYGLLIFINKFISIWNLNSKNEYLLNNLLFIRNKELDIFKEIRIEKNKCIQFKKKKYIADKFHSYLLNWLEEFNFPLFGYLFSNFKQIQHKEFIVETYSHYLFRLYFKSNNSFNVNFMSEIKTNFAALRIYSTVKNERIILLYNCFKHKKYLSKNIRFLLRLKNVAEIYRFDHILKKNKKMAKLYTFLKKYSLFLYRPDIKYKKL